MEIGSFREYNPGIDDEYYDTHFYIFALELNDADTSRPITAKLQYADLNSSSWTDCPKLDDSVISAAYSGSEDTWTCWDLTFNVLHYDLAGAIGMIKKIRIEVDYTLPDGSHGTVYSDSPDGGSLYAYTGEYIHPVSVSYDNNTVTGTFRIDRDLVTDTGKLTLKQLTLYSLGPDPVDGQPHYNDRDIKNTASISPFASDGTFTVTYALSGETLNPEYENGLIIVYSYEDTGIDWESSSGIELNASSSFTSPRLISSSLSSSGSGSSAFKMPFNVEMNDADSVTATLLWRSRENGTYAPCDESIGTVVLTRGNTTDPVENWVTSSDSGECLSGSLTIPSGLPGAIGWFGTRFTYTMPDGKTGSFDSPEALPKWYGSFFDLSATYLLNDNELGLYYTVYRELAEGIPNSEKISECLKIDSVRLIPKGEGSPMPLVPSKAEFLGEDENCFYMCITFENLNLIDPASWNAELEMTYSYGKVSWSAKQTKGILVPI